MDDIEINGVILDKENDKFFTAAELVESTNHNLYLTGKAGTGKTTFLKYLKKTTKKKTVILAPTALAAVNAEGQTIHSFFKIDPCHLFVPGDSWLQESTSDKSMNIYERFRYNKEHIQLLNTIDTIVIDEVSMVRCELMDVIDRLLRIFRKRRLEPFGGVQMIFIGDVFQLPPVVKKEDWRILQKFYDTPYFFSSYCLKRSYTCYIELDKIYRQKEEDYISVLNRIREGKTMQRDIDFLNNRVNKNADDDSAGYIILGTTNSSVDEANDKRLAKLKSEKKTFIATIEGEFKSEPAPKNLEIKVGAQIVFVKNDENKRFFNGNIGVITNIGEDNISVSLNDGGDPIVIERVTWQNIEYHVKEEKNKKNEIIRVVTAEIKGQFTQFPIRLGWAITVHKSQGQTFDKVIADLGNSFADGQVYVALSRCTSSSGLLLKKPIDINSIKTSAAVIAFAKNITSEEQLKKDILNGKADKYYHAARLAMKQGKFDKCIDCIKEAVKYRDDTSTDLFQRYVSVWGKRYWRKAQLLDNM